MSILLSAPLEAEISEHHPLILTGAPRDRSYLIVVNGQPRKIGDDLLASLLDLILARAVRPPGFVSLDPKTEAYPLRKIIGRERIASEGGSYRITLPPRRVAIDPTFFRLPDDVVARSIKDQLREACTVLPHTIVPLLLGDEERTSAEPEANERRKPQEIRE